MSLNRKLLLKLYSLFLPRLNVCNVIFKGYVTIFVLCCVFVLDLLVVLISVNLQVSKLEVISFSGFFQHAVVIFFLLLFPLFVDDLHSAVLLFNYKLLLPNLLMLVNAVTLEVCDCVGHPHLAVDIFAVHECLMQGTLLSCTGTIE